MSTSTPAPSVTAPIERKVAVAGIATYLGLAALLGVLHAIGDANLITALPDLAEVFAAPLLPTAITTVAAYLARHTPRPDLDES
ncbi:hypothetical protein J2S43_007847 [Catenuloplanes nepalensis]|uniref:Holin n=1 Tax=Catenuloplanes nepalensis TaxID=587533 RepID=A0ABT9N706_9ACTN|nr:hypothetical protein [Catenuloplanes nepalensis]MDP9799335.1 hypothetical protein [Catenuloplanes nepalensis]